MSPTFIGLLGKTKVLNNSCNQFVYNLYPQSLLILENIYKSGEMQTLYNAFKCFLVNFLKRVDNNHLC